MNPFEGLSDEKLMHKYVQGNNMAFEVLYNRHQSRVYTYISKRVNDKEHVDEIFQNIFLKIHKVRGNYDSKYLFLKWLYTISRCEIIDFFKYKKMVFEELDKNLSADSSHITESSQLDLENMNYLSESEKTALQLRYYSDKDFSEISKSLGVTPSNSRKIISRGLKKLRQKLIGDQND